jgi:hypothetical protein
MPQTTAVRRPIALIVTAGGWRAVFWVLSGLGVVLFGSGGGTFRSVTTITQRTLA